MLSHNLHVVEKGPSVSLTMFLNKALNLYTMEVEG